MNSSLFRQFALEVRQFCWENLAGVLYRCVEHPEPRFDIDGNTAKLAVKEYIDDNSLSILSGLTTKFLVTSAYQEVKKTKPHMPEINLQAIVYRGLLSPEVQAVNQRLMFLTDSKFENLVTEIPSDQRRAYQEHFLGRDVWDLFYQKLRKNRLFLDSQGYGKIKFY